MAGRNRDEPWRMLTQTTEAEWREVAGGAPLGEPGGFPTHAVLMGEAATPADSAAAQKVRSLLVRHALPGVDAASAFAKLSESALVECFAEAVRRDGAADVFSLHLAAAQRLDRVLRAYDPTGGPAVRVLKWFNHAYGVISASGFWIDAHRTCAFLISTELGRSLGYREEESPCSDEARNMPVASLSVEQRSLFPSTG